MADLRRCAAVLAALVLALALAACQSAPTSSSAYADDEDAPPKNALDRFGENMGQGLSDVGEFTFGWVDDVFGPGQPLLADRVEVVRGPWAAPGAATQPATQPSGTAAKVQILSLDLNNGRAAFIDTDGAVYPQQIDNLTVVQIRDAIAGRTWQVGSAKPAKDAATGTQYGLTVFQNGKPVKQRAQWVLPGAKPLPNALKLLMETFDKANRLAHPVSEKVDLLK